MPVSASTVWEVRSTGNDNNGGGFVTGASGTDYSQQNSAQWALTGVTSSGAGATVQSSSAAATMVGNIAQVISGTNFTAGFYQITSVVVGVSITFSTNGASGNICTGVGSNGVINIGGALATIGKATSVSTTVQPGNIIYVKGSFTRTASDAVACSGNAGSPIRILGYNSVRGDGYLGRSGTPPNGALTTTNMATLSYNAGFLLNVSGAAIICESLNISGSVTTTTSGVVVLGANNTFRGCTVVNSSTSNNCNGIFLNGAFTVVLDCDVTMTGSGGSPGCCVYMGGSSLVYGCRLRNQGTGSTNAGVNIAATNNHVVNTVIFKSGCGINVSTSVGTSVISGCTIVGCTNAGINFSSATATNMVPVVNCLITDNGNWGISFGAATTQYCLVVNCDMHNNTSGNISSSTNYAALTNYSPVTSGSSQSDYWDYTNNNFNLRPASGAFGAGILDPLNIGAFQNNGGFGGVGQV